MSNRDNQGRHEDNNRTTGAAEQVKLTRRQKAAGADQGVRPGGMWLQLIVGLAVASTALVSDGALFSESSQIVAVAVLSGAGLVLAITKWDRVSILMGSRLGLLAVMSGVALVISAILSVYHWASIRELLKAAALAEAFLLGAVLIDRETLRDRFLLATYWWTVAVAGAGSILYLTGMRWPQSVLGSYAVRSLATAANRLSAFFGYANTFSAFLLVPIALGVSLAWHEGRRGTAALVGLMVPLFAMQLAASRWGYVVLGLVLVSMLILGMRLVASGGLRRARAAVITCLVLVVAAGSMLVPALRGSSPASDVGVRFTEIGAEVRNSDPATSSIGGRIAMIRDALRYGAAYPVLGSGPGTYASTYFRFRSTNFFAADPHSQAMLWLTETGGVGFAAQMLLVLSLLWLLWTAAVRDAGRNLLLVGAAFGITGLVVHAMLDWDFQSFFLPLMVAVVCSVAVPALVHQDVWLLKPWRRTPDGVQATSRLTGRPSTVWRFVVIVGMLLCITLASLATTAAFTGEKGVAAYKAGALAEAASFFSISQHLNPLNAEYPFFYAKANVALAERGGAPSAEQAARAGFDRAIAMNPWNIKYQIDQARYLLSRGDSKSIAVYENLTRIDPGDPGTFTSLAWAYHVLYQNDTKAMQSLNQAFAADETYYEAWLVLGRIEEASGKQEEAIAAYWTAAEANRTDVQALISLGNLYDQRGNAAGAARAAFELVLRAPDSADARSAFAAVGMGIAVESATIEGRQLKLTWTVTGMRLAESYRLVLVRPDSEDMLVVDGIAAGQNSLEASIVRTIPSGSCRLRLYAMAPAALADVKDPWVAWAESGDLSLREP